MEVEDVDAYLATDVDARRDRLAIEEEVAEVRQRIGMVSNLLSPPVAELRAAEHEETVARVVYEAIMAAAEDPLGHPWARGTQAFAARADRLQRRVAALAERLDKMGDQEH